MSFFVDDALHPDTYKTMRPVLLTASPLITDQASLGCELLHGCIHPFKGPPGVRSERDLASSQYSSSVYPYNLCCPIGIDNVVRLFR